MENPMNRSADEIKKTNVEKMGAPLGEVYSALWQEVAVAHFYWKEYVELFGTKPERITLLNETAPHFFHMLQAELWESSLLHLARLTDPASSFGKQDKSNLTIQALLALIEDAKLKETVSNLVAEAIKDTAFCRDWRNRHIAHRDLKLALEQPTIPLAEGSRAGVNKALRSMSAVLNALDGYYFQSETRFDLGAPIGGAVSLLYVLGIGSRARAAKQKRLEEGKPLHEDLVIWDV
jgi:AbiU2